MRKPVTVRQVSRKDALKIRHLNDIQKGAYIEGVAGQVIINDKYKLMFTIDSKTGAVLRTYMYEDLITVGRLYDSIEHMGELPLKKKKKIVKKAAKEKAVTIKVKKKAGTIKVNKTPGTMQAKKKPGTIKVKKKPGTMLASSNAANLHEPAASSFPVSETLVSPVADSHASGGPISSSSIQSVSSSVIKVDSEFVHSSGKNAKKSSSLGRKYTNIMNIVKGNRSMLMGMRSYHLRSASNQRRAYGLLKGQVTCFMRSIKQSTTKTHEKTEEHTIEEVEAVIGVTDASSPKSGVSV